MEDSIADFESSLQALFSSHVREPVKMLLHNILVGGVWNGFLLGIALVPCRVMRLMVVDICFGCVPSLHWFSFGCILSSLDCAIWIVVFGLGAFSCMVGCLVSLVLVWALLGLLLLRRLLVKSSSLDWQT